MKLSYLERTELVKGNSISEHREQNLTNRLRTLFNMDSRNDTYLISLTEINF